MGEGLRINPGRRRSPRDAREEKQRTIGNPHQLKIRNHNVEQAEVSCDDPLLGIRTPPLLNKVVLTNEAVKRGS